MQKLRQPFLILCFLYTCLSTTFANAAEMRFSLLEDSPILQSDTLLGWDWDWWKKKDDPKKDSTAFRMENILTLEDTLNEAILGQEFATHEVTNHLINYQAGINDPNTPIGVFLFIGPTGVGKTQLAKELSKALLGSELQMIRLDMGEYTVRETVWGLIGPAPGYIGYEKGGVLTEAIRGRKNTIILLDEIEKAAPEVLKLFLSAFDEGRITSGTGETFKLNSAIFILTTNIASEEILELSNAGLDNESIMAEVEGHVISYLSPELYNRTTPTIFKAIPHEVYPKIIDRELALLTKRLFAVKKIHLTFDPSVNTYLFDSLHSNRLGVRPLKRLIEKHITGNLSRFIVMHQPAPQSELLISVEGDDVVIKTLEKA
ncbi:MAG: AAA family ATPase [Legionellaceae bacterium]|nr:AAA family ATPase [Legionellaceae bacterium]